MHLTSLSNGFEIVKTVIFKAPYFFAMRSKTKPFRGVMDKVNQKRTANKYGFLGLILFVFGLAVAAVLFFFIQILNSYPFWDYINGYRLQLGPLTGIYGDITYLPAPLQFFRFTQLFDLAVASAFIGLFVWKLADAGKVTRRTILSASGFTLLVTGTICAVIVYLQVDVLTAVNLPWGAYAWGSERVAYNTQFMGAEYNCTFLNYTQLLYISVFLAAAGFLLWAYFTTVNFKAPSTLTVACLFAASLALLISGLMLLFPGAKFSSPEPSMPATPYAVQATFLVWGGAALLIASVINLSIKIKQAFTYVRSIVKSRVAFRGARQRQSSKTVAESKTVLLNLSES